MNKPMLIQQVFEMRYEEGYRYLDRCGEAMIILEKQLPEQTGKTWMPEEIVPSGARLKCPDLDLVVTFDSYHLIVDQNPASEDTDFRSICDLLRAILIGRFDLRTFIRLGCRRFYMCAVDSIEEAEALSVKMSPFKDWPSSLKRKMDVRACEAVSVHETPDGSTGIRFSIGPSSRIDAPLHVDQRLQLPPRLLPTGQRKALLEQLKRRSQRQKEPLAGVLVDIDYYHVRPSAKSEIDGFLGMAAQAIEEFLPIIGTKGAA